MRDIMFMFIGVGIFTLGAIAPTLLTHFKDRLKTKPSQEETCDDYADGFEAGYKEGVYEMENKLVKDEQHAVESSDFVSKGFDECEWINAPHTPPKASESVSDAYNPMLHDYGISGTEIMTDYVEQQLYKQAVRG